MSELIKHITYETKPVVVFIAVLALSIFIFGLSTLLYSPYIFPAIAAALLICLVISYNPKYWLYCVFLSSPFYLVSNDTDFNIVDLIAAVLWIGGTFVWLFVYILINKKKLVDDISDWLFLLFYVCLIPNLFIGYINGNEMDLWFRSASRFTIPLMYFPIKEHFRTKAEFKRLMLILAISISGLGLYMLIYSAILVQDVRNIWELNSLFRLNQGLIGVSILVFMSMILYFNGKNKFMLSSALVPLILVFIISLSRIFWFSAIVGIFYSLFFLPKNKRKSIIIGIVTLFLIALTIAIIYLGDRAFLILDVYLKRFSSISKFSSDQSLFARFDEYEYAFTEILKFPFAGNGFAHKINFYSRLDSINWVTNNVHNGYILIMMRFGIPLTLVYYGVAFYKYFQTINYLNIAKYSFEKMVLIGLSSGYLLLFITNFLTGSFMSRDGDVLLAIMFGVGSIATRLVKEDVSE